MKIAVLAGDGIGPEIVAPAVDILTWLLPEAVLRFAAVGGAGYEACGEPLPPATLEIALDSDAILFGAVGDWKYDALERRLRPEQAILGLRRELGLFANLRPAILYPELGQASTLRAEVVSGLDLLIVRELTGDIYFGTPRGRRSAPDGAFAGSPEAFDTMRYSEPEVERIARIAFAAAAARRNKLTSVDKANVLETSQLWRDVVTRVHRDYKAVELDHMYVDNAAMQLVRAPKSFDVIVTGNLFGDILSDQAAMLTGSIGMLPSASLNARGRGLFEPSHGSAPDIAGQDIANPLATILSLALLMRHALARDDLAIGIEKAVQSVLQQGLRTRDLAGPNEASIGCRAMGAAVLSALKKTN